MDSVDRMLLKNYDNSEETEEDKFKDLFEEMKSEQIPEDNRFDEENLPKSILWKDLENKVFVDQGWRIKDLIPKQGAVILASISGNRKTWVSMEMAKCIVADQNFLGESRFKTEGENVLYINGENSESEMQRRGRQLGFNSESCKYKLHFINADNINLNKEDGAVWLKAFVKFYEIK
jgi:hypothetical protein